MFEGMFGPRKKTGDSDRSEAAFAAISEVETYWHALREHHHVPKRNDLDPCGMRGALSKAFILECSGHNDPRFRIVGSEIVDLQQRELRGLPLTELVGVGNQKTVREILQDVSRLPATAHLAFEAETSKAAPMELQMILLPMSDGLGQTTRILGCLDFDGTSQTSAHGALLKLSGSIVRPLGRAQQAIVRRMQHRGLRVVSRSDQVRANPMRRCDRPVLTLVTP